MKSFLWSFIFLFCTLSIFFIGKDVDNIDIMSERYKRALDAGANAASKYRPYDTEAMLSAQGNGYGDGMKDSSNIPVDRQGAVNWFYRLFFRNLSVYDAARQEELKKYIPMKAIICYDSLMIADAEDNWRIYDPAGKKEYIIRYGERYYKFTLSDQVYDIENGTWMNSGDIGLESKERELLLNEYIQGELNNFLNFRANMESGNYYHITFALDDTLKEKLSGINGINFIVLCEGIPIPSLNPFKRERFFAYSVGGSEIRREK